MAHRVVVQRHGETEFMAKCKTCGWAGAKTINKQAAEDDVLTHEQYVARVQASLGTRNPGLTSQRDYYLRMAEDQTVSEEHRRQWRMLADELSVRLNDAGGVDDDQLRLL